MNKEVSKNTHVHHVATRVGTNFPYTAPEMEEAFIHVDVISKLMTSEVLEGRAKRVAKRVCPVPPFFDEGPKECAQYRLPGSAPREYPGECAQNVRPETFSRKTYTNSHWAHSLGSSPGRLSGGTTRRTGHTLPAPLWAHPSGTSLGTPRAAKRGTTRCTGHTLLAPLWPPPEAWLHKFVSPLAAKKSIEYFSNLSCLT